VDIDEIIEYLDIII